MLIGRPAGMDKMKKPPVKDEKIESPKLSPKNQAVLRVGAEQLERYDDALQALADGDGGPQAPRN